MISRFVFAVFLVFASPALAQERSDTAPLLDAEALAGCYEIEHAPWPDGVEHLPSPERLPPWLHLLAEPTDQFAPEGALTVEYPEGYNFLPFTYWLPTEGTVLIDAFLRPVRNTIRVVPSGDGKLTGTLRGSTHEFYDDGPSEVKVMVVLSPRPCP